MQIFISTLLGALCLTEAALRKVQRHDSSPTSRRLNFDSCTVLKSIIEYDNRVANKEDKREEICSCEFDDGTIAELNNLGELCAELESTKSVITSSADISFNAETQEASIPVGTTIETYTLDKEASENRRRLQVTGNKLIVIIRAMAPDSETTSSEAVLKREILGIGGEDSVNLASQYKACSYGQLTFSPSTLGNDGSHTVNIETTVTGKSDSVIRGAMVTEANNDLGIQAALGNGSLQYVLLCIPPGTSGGWIAYAYINSYLSVYNNRWCEYPSGLMHEIGHNLGLAHSGDGGNPYGDQSGMMGYSYNQDEGPAMCFNGAKSYQLGWFPTYSQEVESDNPFFWNGDLVGFVDKDSMVGCAQGDSNCDKLIFRLKPQSGDNEYYVQFNRQLGFNSGTKEGGNQVMVVSRGRGTDYSPSLIQAKLNADNQYTISSFGIHGSLTITVQSITLNSSGKSWADVTIKYGTVSPVNPTTAPVEPTSAPVEPTSAPVEPTSAPVEPTSAPVEPTSAPVEPTSSPVDEFVPIYSTEFVNNADGFKPPTRWRETGGFENGGALRIWKKQKVKTRVKNINAYSQLKIEFMFKASNEVEEGNGLKVIIKFNGGSKSTEWKKKSGAENNDNTFSNLDQWYVETIIVDKPSNGRKILIEISGLTTNSGKGDYMVDNVYVTGLKI